MVDLSLKNWTGPDADEFMDLAPDADLLEEWAEQEEWAEHDAARTTPRHPDQPHYPAPFADETVVERMKW
jgi:hypothetical protein